MAYVIGEDCIACGTCIDECPVGAISEGERYSIDADACTECGTCAGVCPSEAISRAVVHDCPSSFIYVLDSSFFILHSSLFTLHS